MSTRNLEHLIGPYIAGELDSDTAEQVRLYIDATRGRQGFFAGIRASVRSEYLSVAPEKVAARARFLHKLKDISETQANTTAEPLISPRPLGAWSVNRSLGWAGAFVLLIAVTLVGIWWRHPLSFRGQGLTQTYATAAAQRSIVKLDDGTQVMLAPQSLLVVPAGFGRGTREVSLIGEAHFTVINSSGTPFVVRTGNVSTRVLGTEFVVCRFADDASVRVAVQTGKVSVTSSSAQRPSVTVTAGMVAQVTDFSATTSANDVEQSIAWTRGDMIFRSVSSALVLDALSRWYGYRFIVTDSAILRQTIGVAGFSTESFPAALMTLQALLDVDVVISDRADGKSTVTLRPR